MKPVIPSQPSNEDSISLSEYLRAWGSAWLDSDVIWNTSVPMCLTLYGKQVGHALLSFGDSETPNDHHRAMTETIDNTIQIMMATTTLIYTHPYLDGLQDATNSQDLFDWLDSRGLDYMEKLPVSLNQELFGLCCFFMERKITEFRDLVTRLEVRQGWNGEVKPGTLRERVPYFPHYHNYKVEPVLEIAVSIYVCCKYLTQAMEIKIGKNILDELEKMKAPKKQKQDIKLVVPRMARMN